MHGDIKVLTKFLLRSFFYIFKLHFLGRLVSKVRNRIEKRKFAVYFREVRGRNSVSLAFFQDVRLFKHVYIELETLVDGFSKKGQRYLSKVPDLFYRS